MGSKRPRPKFQAARGATLLVVFVLLGLGGLYYAFFYQLFASLDPTEQKQVSPGVLLIPVAEVVAKGVPVAEVWEAPVAKVPGIPVAKVNGGPVATKNGKRTGKLNGWRPSTTRCIENLDDGVSPCTRDITQWALDAYPSEYLRVIQIGAGNGKYFQEPVDALQTILFRAHMVDMIFLEPSSINFPQLKQAVTLHQDDTQKFHAVNAGICKDETKRPLYFLNEAYANIFGVPYWRALRMSSFDQKKILLNAVDFAQTHFPSQNDDLPPQHDTIQLSKYILSKYVQSESVSCLTAKSLLKQLDWDPASVDVLVINTAGTDVDVTEDFLNAGVRPSLLVWGKAHVGIRIAGFLRNKLKGLGYYCNSSYPSWWANNICYAKADR